jgi:hypothetical protein
MKISKRVVLTVLAGAAAGLSTTAIAQTMSRSKSEHLGKLDEDEAFRVNPRTGTIQKSNMKISEARHADAMATGAREIPRPPSSTSTAARCTCTIMQPLPTIRQQ